MFKRIFATKLWYDQFLKFEGEFVTVIEAKQLPDGSISIVYTHKN